MSNIINKHLHRIEWLDTMKGFMIIMVVLCHSLILNHNIGIQGHIDSILLYMVNTFIMPCFFAVSGFLYSRINNKNQYVTLLYKKFISLVIPYIIFSIIFSLYLHSGTIWSIFYQPIFLMWFLLALFWMFIIVGLLDLMRIPLIIQTILSAIAMVLQTKIPWWTGQNYNMNIIACIFGYLIFFYIGISLRKYYPLINKFLKNKVIMSYIIAVFIVSLIFQMYFTGIFPYNTDQVMLSDVVTKVISTLLGFQIFNTIPKLYNNKILSWIGKSTLIIYLVHYFIIHVSYIFILHTLIITSPLLQTGVRFLMGMMISLLIVKIVQHSKLIYTIFYPRNLINSILFKV